jgi:serine phosphatase RsbU (regulator of sigma subunit)/CHASE1-domain containing sensor protein
MPAGANPRDRRARVIGTVVVVALVVGTVAASASEFRRQQRAEAERDRAVAEEAATSLLPVRDTLLSSRTAAALVDPGGELDGGRFRAYADALLLDPLVLSVAYEPRLPADELPAFERETGIEVYERGPDGEPVELSGRPEYFPVQYVRPEQFSAIVGFDLSSEAVRAAALAQARASGAASLTAPTQLGPVDRTGVLVVTPLFRPEGSRWPGSGELVGAVTVGYFAEVLAASVLAQLPDGTSLVVTDEGVPLVEVGQGDTGAESSLEIGGRQWLIRAAHPQRASFWPVTGISAFGLLLAAVAAAGFAITDRRRAELEAAHARTSFLQAATASLAGAVTPDEVGDTTARHLAAVPGLRGVRVLQATVDGLVPLAAHGDGPGPEVPATHGADEQRGVRLTDLGDAVVATVGLRGTRGRRGVVLLEFEASPRPDDVEFVEAIATMAGAALDRAELHAVEHEIAESFQAQLQAVPDPCVGGLGVGVAYWPALEEAPVGGDWYDLFTLEDDVVIVAIGDVVGSGVLAAAAAVELRVAIRSLASVLEPAALMTRLDSFATSIPAAAASTAAVFRIDLARRALSYVSAGHPPAVLLDGDGERLLDAAPRPPLGCGFPSEGPLAHERLEGSARLVCYTDGVVEQPGTPIDMGIDRVRDLVVRTGTANPREAARSIMRTSDEHSTRRHVDDRLVLCVDVPAPPGRP